MTTRPLVVALCVLAAGVIAACGGGDKQATPSVKPTQGPGGTVGAQPTVGRLGPAEIVQPGGTKVIGKPGPMLPGAQKPSKTELHGVAGGVACASASATPSRSNAKTVSSAILCLLNNERANKGLAPLHL